jgi:hypothetical protein
LQSSATAQTNDLSLPPDTGLQRQRRLLLVVARLRVNGMQHGLAIMSVVIDMRKGHDDQVHRMALEFN